jgi:flavin reductase (DIM6/NTAB) family NADH-FMN oxidoreductase RutF
MSKIEMKPSTIMMPVPAAMISCAEEGKKPNIITISWIGIVNSEPPMLSISIRQNRHSYSMVKNSGDFVVNLTFDRNLKEVDYCGTKSGKNHDKFAEMNLTPMKASIVTAPLIKECPINHECVVKQSHLLGSHEIFIAEIVKTHIDADLVDEKGKLDPSRIFPLAYCPGTWEYRKSGERVGRYGKA